MSNTIMTYNPIRMNTTECDITSNEYKERYVLHLVKLGMPHSLAEKDYESWDGLYWREGITSKLRNPEADAVNSFQFWIS